MWARVLGGFAVGFAAGVLSLALTLWNMGTLRLTPAPQTATHPVFVQPPAQRAAAAPLPVGPALPDPGASVQSLPKQAPVDGAAAENPAPPPEGGAERAAPEPGQPQLSGVPHLAMPLEGVDVNRLRDTFNDKRDGRKHEALDIPAPRGTPVRAVDEGNVAKLFTSKLGGLTVYQFDDSGKWCYYYAHLDHYAPGLNEGTLLRRGDVLGYVGTTGNAPPNAPHLHFALFRLGPEKHWWQGEPVDPMAAFK